ncbi:MAG: threonylcarbamoyl-AMP synthase [Acidimicrobiales bacterium]|nr:threonylcarbamoyl-AMP synthase [Acidimicrobiales bacterium]MCB9372998.1 threonylcarbamoyl-AMP synthase [Microthrixaceae bacterium]
MAPTPGITDEAVERAVVALRSGGAVVLPTDTVYGLAALPTVDGAVDRLYALKGRPADMPVAVLVADVEQVRALADLPDPARRLAGAFWPGPLTLVLPRRPGLDLPLGGAAATIGVRWPDHPLVARLATAVGPLATTSANRTGRPTPVTAGEAAASLTGDVAAVLDGGPCAGTASTVVDVTGPEPVVLREGGLVEAQVRAALAARR